MEIDYTGSKLDIRLTRGDSCNIVMEMSDAEGNPLDFTGLTLTSQVRSSPYSDDSMDFNISTENSIVTLSLTPEETSQLKNTSYWDLQVVSSEETRTVVGGKIYIENEVTKNV